jgi:hypothetical protein
MGGVDFRDQQRNVGIHAVIFGVADDGIARAGEVFFGVTCDTRIEGGENKVALEAGVEAFDDEIARVSRDCGVQVPAHGFGVRLAGGALGGGYFG